MLLKELMEKTFLAELEEILVGKFIEPNAPTDSDEEVVGEMDELEKAIYTLSTKKLKLAKMSVLQLAFENPNDDERFKLKLASLSLEEQAEALRQLMWALIKDRFNLWDKSIGVRRGFLIVWFDEKKKADKTALDLLSFLLKKPDE